MSKEVSAIELHQKFIELLNGIYYNGDRLIVKQADKPLAAIIPIEIYDRLIKQREEAFSSWLYSLGYLLNTCFCFTSGNDNWL